LVSEKCINVFAVLPKIDFSLISTKGGAMKIDFSLISTKGETIKIFLIVIVFVIGLVLIIYTYPSIVAYIESHDYVENKEGALRLRYAYETINIRAGRSTDFDIVGKLYRGDMVVVDSLKDDWVKIYKTGISRGYVFYELLKEDPIPNYEIVSWGWQKEPDSLVVRFNISVRNNTRAPKDYVIVEFTTFDTTGNVVATERTRVIDLFWY
jgi:uncharacterized protein YgiM (DUF1202 family)